ncbi:phytoene desaturase family protein [Aestuariispira insulae]|uniref:Pyridine nucleotide-disulfide oxidoreductase domain-containing protein 2 n=1 Tax=Aestuariispira insulae TaxID=1461337 RepID=A0A3D9H597_9PROT|nr:NAD(P)/FAD-dependent oxidoreductase [Aestuariispira insulae]RED44650.1 phytoene dehydrogenase-like protein [Aestuariispira insulae]
MSMKDNYDAVIIGGGHNGLVCASYLAKAGRKVLVLEANDQLGGAAPGCAHIINQLNGAVANDLELTKHGLKYTDTNLATIALGEGGEHLKIEGTRVSALNGAALSEEDRVSFNKMMRSLHKFSNLLGPVWGKKPPRLKNQDLEDKITLGKLGLSIRMLGKRDMQDFLRIALMNAADLVEDAVENKLLQGAIAVDSVWGTHLAPRSPGTVLSLFYRLSGAINGRQGALALPAGGMGAVVDALVAAAASNGVDIRTGAAVEQILVENDRACGVQLAGGEIITANLVISNADPKRTFLNLLGARHLDAGFVRRISKTRTNGNTARLTLKLNSLPEFTGLARSDLKNRLLIAPDILYLEEAFNQAKYGEFSNQPAMEIVFPEGAEPTLSALVQYAPYHLKGGWTDEARTAFLEKALDQLDRYAPGIRDHIRESELLTPADIEARYHITGGHWHHVEMQIDQMLMMRPVHGSAQYQTPMPGLYLCGAGAHPGGSVTGAPGMNAAKRILAMEA